MSDYFEIVFVAILLNSSAVHVLAEKFQYVEQYHFLSHSTNLHIFVE